MLAHRGFCFSDLFQVFLLLGSLKELYYLFIRPHEGLSDKSATGVSQTDKRIGFVSAHADNFAGSNTQSAQFSTKPSDTGLGSPSTYTAATPPPGTVAIAR